MTLQEALQIRLRQAIQNVLGEDYMPQITATADLQFGDYQSNAAMILAKSQKTNPRQLAQRILEALEIEDLGSAEIAGPGFLNFRIRAEAFAARAAALATDPMLGTSPIGKGIRIVIDFSAPNIAKPMHVGHIRSTIIGDALSRIARFAGYDVITDNHIGDWGTQFGMILYGWKHFLNKEALEQDPIQELVRVYRHVNEIVKSQPDLLESCKQELVKLQAGDPENLGIWKQTVHLSRLGLDKIYHILGVSFDHWLGESFYNDQLKPLVETLLREGVAQESEGAVCVFSNHTLPLEQDPFQVHNEQGWVNNPCIVRKADGGFLYSTTDLATLEYRINQWKADQIWYVVGTPQQLHFRQVFDIAKRMKLDANCKHIAFGSILGEDRKLMKTRSGDNVQLSDLLAEALERATQVIQEKSPHLSPEETQQAAQMIGIGAVKFAELSQNRLTDYVFSWDRMLALQGDTAPYLQYSHVRILSIFRKLETPFDAANATLCLQEPTEIHLARMVLRFGETIPLALEDHRPNLLANYLLELARAFHAFFEKCPVLQAEQPIKDSRLLLCNITARVLNQGLDLLGIGCPERM